MKSTFVSLVIGLALSCAAVSSSAGVLDDLKNKAKKEAKRQATKTQNFTDKKVSTKKKQEKTNSRQQKAAVAKKSKAKSATSLANGPDASLISMTKCANLGLENIMLGFDGNYTFQQGFSKEKRSGFVQRTAGTVKDGCILPSLLPRQIAYMEVDTKKYEAMGSDWTMQCVKSANPSAGAVSESESISEAPYKVTYLSGKDVMLHCGHAEALVSTCAEGSNSSRSGKYKKELKARGKTMLSVHGTTSTLAPAGGEKLYCQYYNKSTNTALFAFEYLRTRN